MSGGYEVHASKAKFGLTIIGLGAFAAYAVYGLLYQDPQPLSSKWGLIFKNSHHAMIAALIILVPFLLFSFKHFFLFKPVIRINGEGVYDERHTKEVIPWNGISNVGLSSMDFLGAKLELLVLEFTEYQKQNTRFTLLFKMNALFYNSTNPNVIFFHLNGLDCDHDELLQAMHAQRYARPAQQPKRSSNSNRLFG